MFRVLLFDIDSGGGGLKTREEFDTLITPMGLDKVDKGAPGQQDEGDAASTFMDVIDDSFYFGVVNREEDSGDSLRFPTTYPFSATVPRVGLALLKVLPSNGPQWDDRLVEKDRESTNGL